MTTVNLLICPVLLADSAHIRYHLSRCTVRIGSAVRSLTYNRGSHIIAPRDTDTWQRLIIMVQVEYWRFLRVLATVAFFCLTSGTPQVSADDSEKGTRQFAVAVGFQNQKLYEAAIEEWETFLQTFPQDSRIDKATHYLGTCQLQAKQFAAAAASFETVLQEYPKFELLDQTLLN